MKHLSRIKEKYLREQLSMLHGDRDHQRGEISRARRSLELIQEEIYRIRVKLGDIEPIERVRRLLK